MPAKNTADQSNLTSDRRLSFGNMVKPRKMPRTLELTGTSTHRNTTWNDKTKPTLCGFSATARLSCILQRPFKCWSYT